MKIALHIRQEYRHVYQVFPLGAASLQHQAHIAENGMALRFKIKSFKIAAFTLH